MELGHRANQIPVGIKPVKYVFPLILDQLLGLNYNKKKYKKN